jgi:hypothetical protein
LTIEQLRSTLRAQPFRPFRLRLADGRTSDVSHPGFVSSTSGGRPANRVSIGDPQDGRGAVRA